MSTGWLRDLTPPGKWYVDKHEPWRVRATPGHLVAFCGTLPGHPDPNPVRAERHASLIALTPEMAMFLADTIDYVEAVGRYLASISDASWAHVEAENLLARFADLQPKQTA